MFIRSGFPCSSGVTPNSLVPKKSDTLKADVIGHGRENARKGLGVLSAGPGQQPGRMDDGPLGDRCAIEVMYRLSTHPSARSLRACSLSAWA
jgi:hypothetical protein